jgi:hypothetical protein
MAYDRYDTRRDPRERWRSDERMDRERGYSDREERGFFERAGDEIASWFGDEEAERRRRRESGHHDRGDFRRDRDDGAAGSRWARDDDDRGFFGASSYRGYTGEGPERGPMGSADSRREGERGYRPMTGDYGRGEREFGGRGRRDRDDYRRSSFGGARERSHDPHYAEWRNRQIDELDRDYDEYRRENQSRFESDFSDWRTRRQGKRQMLGQVREHMEVVGSDDEPVGTVDRVAGDRIILTKSDPEAGGAHHSLPCTMVDSIDGDRIRLDCSAEDARQQWRDESRERALFEREDQGEAGPHMLDRSFSGTYR